MFESAADAKFWARTTRMLRANSPLFVGLEDDMHVVSAEHEAATRAALTAIMTEIAPLPAPWELDQHEA